MRLGLKTIYSDPVAERILQEPKHRGFYRSCRFIGGIQLGESIVDMEVDCPPRNIQDARNLAGRFAIGCPTKHRYLAV
jgi:hypothetical protein